MNHTVNIIINANSKSKKGIELLKNVLPCIPKRFMQYTVYQSDKVESTEKITKELIEKGERNFVSASGDGGVNILLNAIIRYKNDIPLSDFTIGAIGIGSSNDYHKPFGRMIHNIPVRLDYKRSHLRDVGSVEYYDRQGNLCNRYFLTSSSVGIVAEGNYNFNSCSWLVQLIKSWNTNLAIFWTFLKTLGHFHNIPLLIIVDKKELFYVNCSYLAITKSSFISGVFHFAEKPELSDGRFMIKLLHNYSRTALINASIKLSKGCEDRLKNKLTRFSNHVSLTSADTFVLEFDGEIIRTDKANISIYKEKIRECA